MTSNLTCIIIFNKNKSKYGISIKDFPDYKFFFLNKEDFHQLDSYISSPLEYDIMLLDINNEDEYSKDYIQANKLENKLNLLFNK